MSIAFISADNEAHVTQTSRNVRDDIGDLRDCPTANRLYRNPATSSVLGCLVPSLGGANETALQTRRQTSEDASSQGGNGKAPQCAKGRAPSPLVS